MAETGLASVVHLKSVPRQEPSKLWDTREEAVARRAIARLKGRYTLLRSIGAEQVMVLTLDHGRYDEEEGELFGAAVIVSRNLRENGIASRVDWDAARGVRVLLAFL